MAEEITNEQNKATFSFRDILASPENDTTVLTEVASVLSQRFKNGVRAEVGVSLSGVIRDVLDNLHQLSDEEVLIAVKRLDTFLEGVFGRGYKDQKDGFFTEFAVTKVIRDVVGCSVIMPTAEDDMHGVDLWVDISAEEDGSELLALQIKHTNRFGDRDSDPQYIFKLLDTPQGKEDLRFYLGVDRYSLEDLNTRIRRMENYVNLKQERGNPKSKSAYLVLSSHHNWFDKTTGTSNQRLADLLEKEILNGLVYGEKPEREQNG